MAGTALDLGVRAGYQMPLVPRQQNWRGPRHQFWREGQLNNDEQEHLRNSPALTGMLLERMPVTRHKIYLKTPKYGTRNSEQ